MEEGSISKSYSEFFEIKVEPLGKRKGRLVKPIRCSDRLKQWKSEKDVGRALY